MSSASLETLAKNCTGLRHLEIDDCDDFTEEVLTAFGTHCTLLEGVYLGSDLPVAGVRSMLTLRGPTLRYLSLVSESPDCDTILNTMAEHCLHIKALELSEFTCTSPVALVHLLSSLHDLRELALTGCSGVTDKVLLAIAQHQLRLVYLDLTLTTGYTITGIEALMQALCNLEQLKTDRQRPVVQTPAVVSEWKAKRPQLLWETGAGSQTEYFRRASLVFTLPSCWADV